MVGYELFVVPTPETRNYFAQQFSGCPFEVHPEDFRVSLAVTRTAVEPDPSALYRCRAGNMKIYANAQNPGSSMLLLPLISDTDPRYSMMETHREVSAFGLVYDLLYSPHLVIVKRLPPMRNYIKGWINSLSGIFLNSSHVFTFHNETVEAREVLPLPESYYYLQEQQDIVDMLKRQSRY